MQSESSIEHRVSTLQYSIHYRSLADSKSPRNEIQQISKDQVTTVPNEILQDPSHGPCAEDHIR